jgi:hypothetical protein
MFFRKEIQPEKIKKKNTKELQRLGIEVIDHLPFLDQASFRDSKEIAKRIMILTALFQLHLEAPKDIIKSWIEKNGLIENLTEKEKEYLKVDYKELPEQDRINIYWYVEALWTFAWIGGMHESLSFNTGVEDSLATMLPNIANGDLAEPFISKYKLRKQSEIFEILDKFYRAHWFARNNNLQGIESEKADLDIIMERRKALEFTCYSYNEWNEISLDT